MIVVDSDGIIENANGHLRGLLGDTFETFIGAPMHTLIESLSTTSPQWLTQETTPRDIAEESNRAPIRIETDALGSADIRVASYHDGRYIIALLPISADEVEVFRRSLRQHQGTIDALMGLGNAGIFLVDAGLNVSDFNDLAIQFSIVSEDERSRLIGSPVAQVVRLYQEDSTFAIDDAIRRSVATDQRREFSVAIDIGGTGERRDGVVSIIPIMAEALDRELIAAVAVEDVSEERRIRRELQNLQHADDICRAATGIAHELNNNATAMISILGRVEREVGESDDETREDFLQLQSALRRVRRLGVQLERFAWRETERDEDDPVWISGEHLEELIHDTVPLATGGTNVRTTFTIDPNIPAVAISSAQLTQVLFNIVLNAVQAMNEGGTLRVELRHDPGEPYCTILVRDEGTGMDPRLIRNAFRPYFSTKTHGIGMGLTVALSIVESNGGRIELETEPGFGTTVRVQVPTVNGADSSVVGDAVSNVGEHVSYADKRVLLVEDDPLVRRSMEMMIRNLGCDVVAVHSGERAVAVFQGEYEEHRKFDALVTDFAMPGRVNGVQLVRRLREFEPDLPAVLSSGALHRNNAIGYREAGFQFVLRKPFGEHEIKTALAAVL
jgi:signal transduction histidine kinase/ActR/RegA family two-component response regulator